MEAQVSDLDNKLQITEAKAKEWKGKADELDVAELEVGKMALEMEAMQEQLLDVLQERDYLLSQVQQLRDELSTKDRALKELEAKHQLFVQDYEQMQGLLTDIQEVLTSKEAQVDAIHASAQAEISAMRESMQRASAVQEQQVTIIAKESDLVALSASAKGEKNAIVAGPQSRGHYSKASVYIVKRTGYTCTLFSILVLQVVILALLMLYLQVNFQMIMLTDNEDIIERLLRFRSTY